MSEIKEIDPKSIFLESVHRSMAATGHRPTMNIISSSLLKLILSDVVLVVDDPKCKCKPWCGFLFGYPVRVVESPYLVAVSIDSTDL